MQNTTQYAPCPNCGQSNAKKVGFTWWGGALGPNMFTHVKCQNCETEYNGKTGKSNQTNILIYFLVTFVIAFCVCGGFAFLSVILNNR
jgi:transposase-like protein